MNLTKLTLENFRNIEFAEIIPDKGINVIYGSNAQGKTSLLEALWCFTGAKSFRGCKDGELIRFGAQNAKISLIFFDGGREQECVISVNKTRTAVLNGVEYSSASQIAGKIYAIVFSPNDLNIIKDGPVFRRRFLDSAIFQLYPAYIGISRRYLRALDQRNRLLKDIKYNPMNEEFIDVFEKELAVCGAAITGYRKRYIEMLEKHLREIYNGISGGKEEISAEYMATGGEKEEEFLEALKNCRRDDLQTFSTSVGPHRDDISININGISARSFGSQGQKRSAALAMKLAESAVINEVTGKNPIALLDDVMSELDNERQNYILNHIKDWQVFITCCDAANISGFEKGKIFEVKKGKIISVT